MRQEDLIVQFKGSQAGDFPLTEGSLGFCNFQAFNGLDEDPTLVRANYFIRLSIQKLTSSGKISESQPKAIVKPIYEHPVA